MNAPEIRRSVDATLESVPEVFRGYDRDAVKQLFTRLKLISTQLADERDGLKARLEAEQSDTAELYGQLSRAQQRAADAIAVNQELAGQRDDLRAQLDAEQGESAGLRRQLSEVEQRAADQLAKVKVELDSVCGREQGVEDELRLVQGKLQAYEGRELVLTKMLDSARGTSAAMIAEARADADTMLKKATRRAAAIVKMAEGAQKAAEGERRRLHGVANELRGDLSGLLMSTLERLKAGVEAEQEPAGTLSGPPTVDEVAVLADAVEKRTRANGRRRGT
jgi:chromosome segregation ATPase